MRRGDETMSATTDMALEAVIKDNTGKTLAILQLIFQHGFQL